MKAKRIQRKRTKGWRMPPNTVYVGRPSWWENPFKVGEAIFGSKIKTREVATGLFEDLAIGEKPWDGKKLYVEMIRKDLRGKNLACWCPLDQPCHADILLKIANRKKHSQTPFTDVMKKVQGK